VIVTVSLPPPLLAVTV
jgi:hypothetical protein